MILYYGTTTTVVSTFFYTLIADEQNTVFVILSKTGARWTIQRVLSVPVRLPASFMVDLVSAFEREATPNRVIFKFPASGGIYMLQRGAPYILAIYGHDTRRTENHTCTRRAFFGYVT